MKPIIVAEKTEALDWIVYEKHATHMVSLGGGWLSLQVIN